LIEDMDKFVVKLREEAPRDALKRKWEEVKDKRGHHRHYSLDE
jgi:hypothetical protein